MNLGDIQSRKLILSKGGLFLVLGLFSAALLLLDAWSWRVAGLLAVCVWSFCRFYYFAFYVIQNYVDPGYKFAGLGSFVRYMLGRKADPANVTPPHETKPN
jgi:hypothetical protein